MTFTEKKSEISKGNKKNVTKDKYEFLDKIYIINLERNVIRKEKMLNKLNNFTKKYSFFKAVDGSVLKPNDYYPHISSILVDDIKNKQWGVDLTLGGIGCAMSHKKIWEMTVKEKHNRVLVLEDDAIILDNFNNLEEMLNYVPEDWDIIYLGSSQYKIKTKVNNYVSKLDYIYTTIGYIINYRSASRLLNMFPIRKQIDTVMNWAETPNFNSRSINRYIIEPNVINNGFGKTDIQIK